MTIKQMKSRLVPGARLLCIENSYRPVLNGTCRVVFKVGRSVWQWKFQDKPDERPSHSEWPSGIKIVDADTFKIPIRDEHYVTLRFVGAP